MTGINEKMVRRAPKFYEIAKRVVKMTEDCVFVAHNVKFDYRVVQLEFERLGFDYHRKTLDTIDLAKRLIPNLKTYGLEALCDELGISNLNRHRADGDARATVELFKILLDKDTGKMISQLSSSVEESEKQHPFRDLVRPLKNATGVYYLYNSAGNVIYLGMSSDLQNSINRHFLANNKVAVALQKEANAINIEETGNVAIAHIKAFHELRRLKPLYNKPNDNLFLPAGIMLSREGRNITFIRVMNIRNHDADLYFKDSEDAYTFLTELFEYSDIDPETVLMEKDYKKIQGSFSRKVPRKSGKNLSFHTISKLFLITPDFMAIGPGRHPNEKSLILVKKGKVTGYAYYELDSFLDNPKIIENHLVRLKPHAYYNSIVRHYLSIGYLKKTEWKANNPSVQEDAETQNEHT
jgi:DNA polymerase-3 subunit epsilon